MKKWVLGRLKKIHDKGWGIANRLQATSRAEEAVNSFLNNSLTYGTYALMGFLILNNTISLDIGVQAIALSAGLYTAVKSSFSAITVYSVARIAEKRIAGFWHTPSLNKQLTPNNEKIEFSNVFCGYNNKQIMAFIRMIRN